MEIRYFTKVGSVYTQRIEGQDEFWFKTEKDGQTIFLTAGVHIAFAKLKELIREYPSSMLDKTFCFSADVEKEFLADAKKEAFIGDLEDVAREQTVICFLEKIGTHYKLGCSSLIERMEEGD
jgi:hypothetical protein